MNNQKHNPEVVLFLLLFIFLAKGYSVPRHAVEKHLVAQFKELVLLLHVLQLFNYLVEELVHLDYIVAPKGSVELFFYYIALLHATSELCNCSPVRG